MKRITVNLTPRAQAALESLQSRYGLNTTDTIGKALTLWAMIADEASLSDDPRYHLGFPAQDGSGLRDVVVIL